MDLHPCGDRLEIGSTVSGGISSLKALRGRDAHGQIFPLNHGRTDHSPVNARASAPCLLRRELTPCIRPAPWTVLALDKAFKHNLQTTLATVGYYESLSLGCIKADQTISFVYHVSLYIICR